MTTENAKNSASPGSLIVTAQEYFDAYHLSMEEADEEEFGIRIELDTIFRRAVLSSLKPETRVNNKVLDVGIGSGYFWKNIKDIELTGLDISKQSLLACRDKKIARKLVRVDASSETDNWTLEDNSFGLVVSKATLLYVQNAALVIKRMIDKTAPGGTLVISNSEPRYSKPSTSRLFQNQMGEIPVFYHSFNDVSQAVREKNSRIIVLEEANMDDDYPRTLCIYQIFKPA